MSTFSAIIALVDYLTKETCKFVIHEFRHSHQHGWVGKL